jgi:DNA-binding NarL/FixJ family response regulator
MVKKRPREGRCGLQRSSRSYSKTEIQYWRNRLYRNTFTYAGKRYEVAHWSIKIQHQGTRKAFSLHAMAVHKAAAEACKLYKTILTRGWESMNSSSSRQDGLFRRAPGSTTVSTGIGFDSAYWAQRLIHRKYTESLHPKAEQELSVRIDHEGTGHYFPLGTDNRRLAAQRAVEIHKAIAGRGWATAIELFPRELSVAFRWADNPLAWTYTTLQTLTGIRRTRSALFPRLPAATLKVSVAESDPGLRQALEWCVNQQQGCCCRETYSSGSAALRELSGSTTHLILVSQNLTDMPGAACLKQLSAIAPKVIGLLFSAYEDSDHLFKSAPGGAPIYLLRRSPPTQILEPIAAAWKNGILTRENMAKSIRHYFENAIVSLPVGGSVHESANLTDREHEILALLSKGHPDKEIADLLRISTWTVHGHLKNIFAKLGAHNRTDAVVKYLNK